MDSLAAQWLGGDRPVHPVLSVYTAQYGRAHVVSIAGELDIYTGPEVRDTFLEICAAQPGAVVVDLHGLTFIDSSGLGVLIGGERRVRCGGGRMGLAACNGRVLEVITITGLHQALPIFGTLEEALRAFADPPC